MHSPYLLLMHKYVPKTIALDMIIMLEITGVQFHDSRFLFGFSGGTFGNSYNGLSNLLKKIPSRFLNMTLYF